MKRKTVSILGLVIAMAASAVEVQARIRWHHESVVYFQVWELGKCACQTSFVQSWQRADTLPTVNERRAAMQAAKADRKICRRAAKQRAHEAYLQSRKERVEARRLLREEPR